MAINIVQRQYLYPISNYCSNLFEFMFVVCGEYQFHFLFSSILNSLLLLESNFAAFVFAFILSNPLP